MKILQEDYNRNAWCMNRRGDIIPVRVHPFGALDDDAIEDAAWLFLKDSMLPRNQLSRYMANQICYDYGVDELWQSSEIATLITEVISEIESIRTLPNYQAVIKDVIKYQQSIKEDVVDLSEEETQALGTRIKKTLNENYLRIRYGSEYQNRIDNAGAVYFRTSSTDGYNWYNNIVKFLEYITSTRKVLDVTIERDVSATGDHIVYYSRMPLSEFLMASPIVVENVKKCGTLIEK